MNRRHFLATTAAAAAAPSLPAAPAKTVTPPMVGVQMAPFNLLIEGIPNTLDLLKEKAAVNTLIFYSHTYYGGSDNKPAAVIAPDHGVDPTKYFQGAMPDVWVRHDPANFKDTLLQHQQVDPSLRFADRDVFQETAGPAKERDMKIYVRYFDPKGESGEGKIVNWDQVRTVDIEGNPAIAPCWLHPEYEAFTIATFNDIADRYPIDGILWGAEIPGPLSEPLYWARPPYGFSEFDRAWAEKKGIDFDRAKEGYAKLWTAIKTGNFPKGHQRLVGLLGILQRYPEVLGWHYQYEQAYQHYRQNVYDAVKARHPHLDMGWHIDNQITGWDVIARSALDYHEIAGADDFLRASLYFHILGPRLKNFGIQMLDQTVFQGIPQELSLQLHYHLLGLDPDKQPKDLAALEQEGLDPDDYIEKETRRAVEEVKGEARICPAIGFDVPNWGGDIAYEEMKTFETPPELIERAVHAAHRGGADGLMAAREYDELRVPNLEAFGRAVRETFLA